MGLYAFNNDNIIVPMLVLNTLSRTHHPRLQQR